MLTTREVIKTFYNALLQRLKKHRGDWNQNDPTADDYIKNRPFYTDETKKVVKLDKKYLPNEALTGVKTVNGIEPDDTGNVAVEIPAGGVQTVNGVAPDENGNVSVEIDLSNYMTLNTDQAVSDKYDKYKHIQGGFSIRQTGNTSKYPCTYIGYDDLLGDCVEIRYTANHSSAVLNRDSDGRGRLRLYNGMGQSSYATLSPTYLDFKRNGYHMNLSADERGNMIVGAGELGTNRALIKNVANPISDTDAATKEYIDKKISDNAIVINSSTTDSNKRFKITVDDSGALTATEVTE